MEEYPSNSHKSKEKEEALPEKKVDKVIVGNVKTTKKKGLNKLFELFVSDEINDIKSYVLFNIVIPGIKRIISDGVDVALNGETGRRRTNGTTIISNYRGGYHADDRSQHDRFNIHDLYEIDDITLDNYGDCVMVLDEMNALIERYGLVSVSDLYDMLGRTGRSHTDCKYGWNSLKTARIIPVHGGFKLKLPRVIPLN